MTEKNDANRRRKWAPKARTGCRTCKTRHVKCDEQKPVCRRCVLSGFRCDGYPVVPSKRENGSPPSDSASPESASSDGSSSLAIITTRLDSTSTAEILTEKPSTCTAITPMVVAPREPYMNSDRGTLRFFVDVTAPIVGRSRAGPIFWQKFVPQAAWQYPSVRHALLASAVACQSLVRPDIDMTQRKSLEVQVLTHTSKAVHSLLSEKVPLDVVMLTSATLGILDLFNGQWDTACTHVTSGAKLAKQARQDPNNEPFISFYCEAFASALPHVLKDAQNGSKPRLVEKNSIIRLDEAVRSLRLAIMSFDEVLPKVLESDHQNMNRSRIVTLVNTAKAETQWILTRWNRLLQKELQQAGPQDDVKANLHRVESPFSAVIADLKEHLDHGGPFDMAKFEVAIERTMPFYTLAKSGPSLEMRLVAVELMRLGAELRGRWNTSPSGSPPSTRTIEEISNEDER